MEDEGCQTLFQNQNSTNQNPIWTSSHHCHLISDSSNYFQNVRKIFSESPIPKFFWNFVKISSEFRNTYKFSQNFRITFSWSYSQKLRKIWLHTGSKLSVPKFSWHLFSKFPNIYFLKLFPKYRKNFLKIVCFKTFLLLKISGFLFPQIIPKI